MKIKDTVVIKSGNWDAGVCPRLGGNLIYLRYCGKDILRPLQDEAQLNQSPYLQGSPILLPANRIYLGKFRFEGVDYTLPITEPRTNSHLHGTVHRQPFETLEVTEASVTIKFSNTGLVYPFNFDMVVTYRVDEEGLTQEYEIINTDTKNMPYTFCLHSTFMQPDSFSLPIIRRQEHDEIDIPTGRYLPLTEQERLYVTGSPSRNVGIVGYYESCGHTARIDDILYTVSDNFDYWIMYNANGRSDFLCIEPQAGKVNGLNIEDGYKVLAPGESVTYTTRYTHI
jgi:aldose 1-epimerase